MLYLFWLSLLLILLAILIVKFIDFISPIICDAATSVIKKTIQKYSPKPQPPKIIYNVVEKKEQPVQQYHIQLIAPEPPKSEKSEEPVKPVKLVKPTKREESIEKSEESEECEECEEIEEYTEDSTTSSDDEEEKQVLEDCAELLTKLVVNTLGIHESKKSEKPTKPEKQEIDEEKINSLIADALNKFKEKQKPTDVTQMNIQQHANSNTEAEKVVKLQHDGCENRVEAEILRCDPTK